MQKGNEGEKQYRSGLFQNPTKLFWYLKFYGCEFWHDISNSDLLLLERSHRFCVKSIQNIDRGTRSCVALSLLGSRSLEKDIQKRKLILCGQLCRLDPFYTIKRIFIY